jgi:hypothetical protein
MGVQLPLPAPSMFSIINLLLLTYVRLECARRVIAFRFRVQI